MVIKKRIEREKETLQSFSPYRKPFRTGLI